MAKQAGVRKARKRAVQSHVASRACSRVLKRAYLGRFTGSLCRLLCPFWGAHTDRTCVCVHARVRVCTRTHASLAERRGERERKRGTICNLLLQMPNRILDYRFIYTQLKCNFDQISATANSTCWFAFDQLISFLFLFFFFFARGLKKGCDCRLVDWFSHFRSQAGF